MNTFKSPLSKYSRRVFSECTVDVKRYFPEAKEFTSLNCEKALWDTGSPVSIISDRIASELRLTPVGRAKIRSLDGKPIDTNRYIVDIVLNDTISIKCVEVFEAPSVVFDVLIGMDIIERGNLSLNNLSDNPYFIFETY